MTIQDEIELSIIIPTYNERDSIRVLVAALLTEASAIPLEIIVVDDDSPDRTAEVVIDMNHQDSRVHLLPRPSKQGLAGAVFAGVRMARGEFIAVLDADFSHDPAELPGMLVRAYLGSDIIIGSRFLAESNFAGQPLLRTVLSRVLNFGVKVLLRLRTQDVLTGYVLCRRECLDKMPTHYSAKGFKWLVELLVTQPHYKVHEIPIVFKERKHGVSKATPSEILSLVVLCTKLRWWQIRHGRIWVGRW